MPVKNKQEIEIDRSKQKNDRKKKWIHTLNQTKKTHTLIC